VRHRLCLLNEVLSETFVDIPNVRRLELLKVDFEVSVIKVVSFEYVCNEGVSYVVVSAELDCLILNTLKGLQKRLD
jgi:hypothetical protein